MTFTCQECGEKLPSAGAPHNHYDCGKCHLKRAYEILGEVMVEHKKQPIVFKQKGKAKE